MKVQKCWFADISLSGWQLSNVASWLWFKGYVSTSARPLLWFPGTESAGWLSAGAAATAFPIWRPWVPNFLPVSGWPDAGAPPEPGWGQPEWLSCGAVTAISPELAAPAHILSPVFPVIVALSLSQAKFRVLVPSLVAEYKQLGLAELVTWALRGSQAYKKI